MIVKQNTINTTEYTKGAVKTTIYISYISNSFTILCQRMTEQDQEK